MQRKAILLCAFALLIWCPPIRAQGEGSQKYAEVVATASEYVPQTVTLSHAAHSYTDCHGLTSYLGSFTFSASEDFGLISGHGDISGTSQTDTHCKTTFSPPGETTLTTYRKVNYVVLQSGPTLHLLACTSYWRPSTGTRWRAAAAANSKEAKEQGDSQERAQQVIATGAGHWSDCPAFGMGDKYALTVRTASEAHLVSLDHAQTKPFKLEYLGSAPVPSPEPPVTTPLPSLLRRLPRRSEPKST